MLNEIKQNKDYDDVFNKGKKISEHVNVKLMINNILMY